MKMPDSETKAQILAAAQTGADLETLADYAGVPKSRMRGWLDMYYRAQRLREQEENLTTEDLELLELFDQCVKLRAKLEVGAVGVIMEAANRGHPRSAIWLLENVFSTKYGEDSQRVNIGETNVNTIDSSKYTSVSEAIKAAAEEREQFELEAVSQDLDIVDAEIVED